MIKRLVLCAIALLGGSSTALAAASHDKLVFSVIMTRHGVRSFTKQPAQYEWPQWQPVAPGFLTAHGYRLVTHLGAFYRRYFASQGLPVRCTGAGTYVYADLDERTLETARALVEGACGSPSAVPIFHDATTAPGTNDPFFDGADRSDLTIDAAASRSAVLATLPAPVSAIVSQHVAEFTALQTLLDGRCPGSCAPVTSGTSAIVEKKGLAELIGPLDVASGYAESLFLQYAQCGPPVDTGLLASAMRLHVLAYDVNARNAYNPLVRGGNVFAHIVGLLEEKAGVAHPGVDVPDVSRATLAMISGHDTQLGAIGGIMNAHWKLDEGLVPDDMPPGGALIFELYESKAGAYSVRTHFAYQTLDQFRSDAALPGGERVSAVTFPKCKSDGCSVPLSQFATLAQSMVAKGYVEKAWTPSSDTPVQLAPLRDPSWTKCR